MNPTQQVKKKDVEKRLRLWLLSGKTITHNQAQIMWGTNRLSEYIRRCRKTMEIEMTMTNLNGDVFGVYKYIKPPKIDRIKTRQYMNQA